LGALVACGFGAVVALWLDPEASCQPGCLVLGPEGAALDVLALVTPESAAYHRHEVVGPELAALRAVVVSERVARCDSEAPGLQREVAAPEPAASREVVVSERVAPCDSEAPGLQREVAARVQVALPRREEAEPFLHEEVAPECRVVAA
jgi:hypothetical protein